ncbi:MAG: hypothetical protein PHY43_10620 [Verrucomicrobiales bacterium]|nr:hypothetical protein [Verrucomicrobiales bacterium]
MSMNQKRDNAVIADPRIPTRRTALKLSAVDRSAVQILRALDDSWRSIQNITFRKIVYDGTKDSLIAGKGPDQMMQGVVVEGLKLNGKPVLKAEDENIVIGKFVSGVEFK